MKYTFRRINREDMCSKGTYKIALVIYSKFDYHWYRQNPDGTWSHKPGYGEVMNKELLQEKLSMTQQKVIQEYMVMK